MPRTIPLAPALALGTALLALPAGAQEEALTPAAFGTNWLPQAEHGGFYQSVADGTYAECGLDVEIVPGGPQVNNRALMLAGRLDFHMGGDMLQAFFAVEEDIPVIAVAAIFQKNPQVILAHPEAASSWEDLKGLDLMIGDSGYASFYQWMIAEHGFTEEQREPYTFNAAPFIADPGKGMQGYLSSEPYAVAREAGFEPAVFLLADAGYASYATTIETLRETIEERPEVVRCFVEGSIRGWYAYLHGDRAAADALILEANPDMSQDKLDYAVERLKEEGIVESGDALEAGIGVITEEVVGGFFEKMATAGVVEPNTDWRASFTTEFVGQGVGMDLVQ